MTRLDLHGDRIRRRVLRMHSEIASRRIAGRAVWIFLPLFLVACDQPLASAEFLVRKVFPQVPQRSVSWLVEQQQGGGAEILLLDVRTPEEFAVSHIRGARRAETLAEARVVLGERPKDLPIVLYCSVGYRSSALGAALLEAGYSQVANLEGSIFAWVHAGEPVVREGIRVHQVHPYDGFWGNLLDPRYRARPEDLPTGRID